jgi:hypothetical protein
MYCLDKFRLQRVYLVTMALFLCFRLFLRLLNNYLDLPIQFFILSNAVA